MTGLQMTLPSAADRRLAKIRRGYRLFAPWFDRLRPLWAGGILGEAERFLERKILPQYCPPGAAVLDLGCGTGANLDRLLRSGIPFRRYAGIDISPAMLGQARKKFATLVNAEFYIGDIEKLSFDDDSFDFVLSTWAFEHLSRVEPAVADALRVLKQSGHLALLYHSLPNFPFRIPALGAEAIFRYTLPLRFLPAEQYSFSDNIIQSHHFAGGLHTLLLLAKSGE